MGAVDVNALIAEARRATLSGTPDVAVEHIDRALEQVSDDADRGRLLLARAIALQGEADPQHSVRDAVEATELLIAAGLVNEAAYAASGAAVFTQRTGRIAEAVDRAVIAMVLRAESDDLDPDWVRAANGVALLFGQLSAFEIAVSTSANAFAEGADVDVDTRELVAYTLCYLTVEARHSGAEVDVGPALQAARWLRDEAESDAATKVLGPGMLGELALLGAYDGDPVALAEAVTRTTAEVAPRVAAWRDLFCAAVHHHAGRSAAAIELLDRALPTLMRLGDEHRVVRAYRIRAEARAATGDLAGAYDDARDAAARVRRSQIEQVGRLATQIQRRADLEVARSALRRRADDLAREISIDALTGVGSRRWFDLELDRLSQRTGWVAVAVFDLDHFKAVNDTFGHHIGDLTLTAVGRILSNAVRGEDPVARLGGEEFAVLLTGARVAQAEILAERVRCDIQAAPWHEIEPTLTLTTSAGVAEGPLSSVREVLRAADAALYDAKRSGRNRVVAA